MPFLPTASSTDIWHPVPREWSSQNEQKPEARTYSHTLEDPNLKPSNYGDDRAYYPLITTGEIVRVRTHQVIHKARSAPPALLTDRPVT